MEAESGVQKVRNEMEDFELYKNICKAIKANNANVIPERFKSNLYRNKAKWLVEKINKIVDESFKWK
jgi:predicted DNA-binding protein